MNEIVTLRLTEFIGTPYGVATEDGQRVYAELHSLISHGQQVRISFRGITRLTTAFLNAAIGQLFGEYSSEEIRGKLLFEDVESVLEPRLTSVLTNSRRFFRTHPPTSARADE